MRRAAILAATLLACASAVAVADSGATSQSGTQVYTFSTAHQGRLGLVVIGLTDELRQFYGAGKDGVLVGKVEPGSPAAKAGVTVGDVIADVDGKGVDDAGDVLALLAGEKKGDGVAMTVMRNHLPLLLTAKLAADAPAIPPIDRNAMGSLGSIDPFGGAPFGGAPFGGAPLGGAPFGAFGVDPAAMKQLEQRIDRLEQRLHKLDGA